MIRSATLQDRPHFLRLWAQFTQDQEKAGSHMLANLNNLYRYLNHFEAYTMGSRLGSCLLCQPEDSDEPIAITMGGELGGGDEFDTNLGKVATMWGVYVSPEFRGRGIGLKLVAGGQKSLLELGFDVVETYTRAENSQAMTLGTESGTTVYAVQHVISLRDPKMLNNTEAKKTLARGGE